MGIHFTDMLSCREECSHLVARNNKGYEKHAYNTVVKINEVTKIVTLKGGET